MRLAAYVAGREMVWGRVASLYLRSFERACREGEAAAAPRSAIKTLDQQPGHLPELKLDHFYRLTDSTGMFQHASFVVPNYAEGYCTDDNARALVLTLQLQALGDISPRLQTQANTFAAFLQYAFDGVGGRFRNFMSFDRRWLEAAVRRIARACALGAGPLRGSVRTGRIVHLRALPFRARPASGGWFHLAARLGVGPPGH